MLCLTELHVLFIVIVLLAQVLIGLLRLLQFLGGGIQLIASVLGGQQVLLQVHGRQLLFRHLGNLAQNDLSGLLRADHHFQLRLCISDVHPQRLQAAGKLGTARLGLGELQGGHLPHLVAQFQLLNGAVQRRKLSLEGRLLGLQPRNGGI